MWDSEKGEIRKENRETWGLGKVLGGKTAREPRKYARWFGSIDSRGNAEMVRLLPASKHTKESEKRGRRSKK